MPKITGRRRSKPFGTVIVDPPWPYQSATPRHRKLSGYSSSEYRPLTCDELSELPVGRLADYLFLWSTPPFHANGQAASVMRSWGFEPITSIYWVKADRIYPGDEPAFKPSYGVGYWFRGCVEPVFVGKSAGVRSIRTAWVGMLSRNGRHSRKPDTLYEVVEKDFPGPYCELFGRRDREGWTVLGNESPSDGGDIRESLSRVLRGKPVNGSGLFV